MLYRFIASLCSFSLFISSCAPALVYSDDSQNENQQENSASKEECSEESESEQEGCESEESEEENSEGESQSEQKEFDEKTEAALGVANIVGTSVGQICSGVSASQSLTEAATKIGVSLVFGEQATAALEASFSGKEVFEEQEAAEKANEEASENLSAEAEVEEASPNAEEVLQGESGLIGGILLTEVIATAEIGYIAATEKNPETRGEQINAVGISLGKSMIPVAIAFIVLPFLLLLTLPVAFASLVALFIGTIGSLFLEPVLFPNKEQNPGGGISKEAEGCGGSGTIGGPSQGVTPQSTVTHGGLMPGGEGCPKGNFINTPGTPGNTNRGPSTENGSSSQPTNNSSPSNSPYGGSPSGISASFSFPNSAPTQSPNGSMPCPGEAGPGGEGNAPESGPEGSSASEGGESSTPLPVCPAPAPFCPGPSQSGEAAPSEQPGEGAGGPGPGGGMANLGCGGQQPSAGGTVTVNMCGQTFTTGAGQSFCLVNSSGTSFHTCGLAGGAVVTFNSSSCGSATVSVTGVGTGNTYCAATGSSNISVAAGSCYTWTNFITGGGCPNPPSGNGAPSSASSAPTAPLPNPCTCCGGHPSKGGMPNPMCCGGGGPTNPAAYAQERGCTGGSCGNPAMIKPEEMGIQLMQPGSCGSLGEASRSTFIPQAPLCAGYMNNPAQMGQHGVEQQNPTENNPSQNQNNSRTPSQFNPGQNPASRGTFNQFGPANIQQFAE